VSIFDPAPPLWTNRMLSVFRIVAGAVFIFHGTQKLFAYPAGASGAGPVDLLSQSGLAGVLETFGGAAILIGFCTRPVAFVLAGEMAVAYFQVHFRRGFLPILNGGDNAVLFCFIFLYLLFAGAGPWSIDHMIARRRAAVPATSTR
jgi:putative oxidoreductase